MPSLSNPKQEQFAQLCARGLPTIEAYVRAGYKRNTGNATSLKKSPEIQARIDELQAEMAGNNQAELNEFLKDTGLSPTYIIRKLKETAEAAHGAGKLDIEAKCWEKLGQELFGMFNERKHVTVEKNSVHTETTTKIDFAFLNQALEIAGEPGPKRPQIEGHATVVSPSPPLLSLVHLSDE